MWMSSFIWLRMRRSDSVKTVIFRLRRTSLEKLLTVVHNLDRWETTGSVSNSITIFASKLNFIFSIADPAVYSSRPIPGAMRVGEYDEWTFCCELTHRDEKAREEADEQIYGGAFYWFAFHAKRPEQNIEKQGCLTLLLNTVF